MAVRCQDRLSKATEKALPLGALANPISILCKPPRRLPIAPCRALDIGCRTGHNTVWLSRQGFEVFGVDASEIAIEKAKAKASEALS